MNRSPITLIVVLIASLGLVACQRASVEQPLTATYPGDEIEQQMEFWHTLAEAPIACNDDALHALLLFFDEADPATMYEGRVATLKARGWLPESFNEPANQAVGRGTIAAVVCKALDIKGGVMMHILGPQPRYALRELNHMGVMPRSTTFQTLTGNEFVALIGRIEDYQRAHPTARGLPPEVADAASPDTNSPNSPESHLGAKSSDSLASSDM